MTEHDQPIVTQTSREARMASGIQFSTGDAEFNSFIDSIDRGVHSVFRLFLAPTVMQAPSYTSYSLLAARTLVVTWRLDGESVEEDPHGYLSLAVDASYFRKKGNPGPVVRELTIRMVADPDGIIRYVDRQDIRYLAEFLNLQTGCRIFIETPDDGRREFKFPSTKGRLRRFMDWLLNRSR